MKALSNSKKHGNIAFFIPHSGCNNQCVFCNQRTISGRVNEPTTAEISRTLTNVASLALPKDTEIAFFGGSFTGIGEEKMTSYLSAAYEFIESGVFSGIRISTRPDFIDEHILSVLKRYGVTSIELGAQSMDDDVLLASHRGHTADDVKKASEMIKVAGFSLGLQMMTGLPKSCEAKELYTAESFIKLSPDTVRIYPTVVLRGTALHQMMRSGEYTPQSVEDAVTVCKKLLMRFNEANVKVIRLGLHADESLTSGDEIVAGAFHPALRELVEGELMYDKLSSCSALQRSDGKQLAITVAKGFTSKAIGQGKRNTKRLKELYSLKNIKVKESDTLFGFDFTIEIK